MKYYNANIYVHALNNAGIANSEVYTTIMA